MTQKLYIRDPYMKEFEALVQKIEGEKVILDRTAFYPESGGQVGDTGHLNGIRVLDCQYGPNKRDIAHIIEGEPSFKAGERVVGKLDWDRRYRIMRLHAASHIMEHFLYETFGELRLVGTHVNEKHDSSTYESEELDPEKLQKVNDLVNDFISEGYEIERREDPNKAEWLYWKAGEIEIPCGGTHPRNTREIGKVSIKRKSGGRGKEKVLTSLVE